MRWLSFPLLFTPWLIFADKDSPRTPAESKKSVQLAPGLKLELVAAEPEIESPVAMEFDEDGRLWVVEMLDYPNGPAPGQPPQGRIKLLEDKDGDGRYETSVVFADKILYGNGLLRWRDGVIVTAAPHVVFLRDTDGDGKADKREVLFEGFAAQNPQLRVSCPRLGLDGWIYLANGLRGGQIKRSGQDKPLNLGSFDLRFDPLGGAFETVTGMGQFGNTFDDWGQRFVCDNRHHLRHIVLADRYLKRNPFLAAAAAVSDPSDLTDGPLNSGGKLYPLSKNWTTSNLHAGRFTAACGIHVYRGDVLPKVFREAVFTCDPTANLVHAERLHPQGGSFKGEPLYYFAKDEKTPREFLATAEEWFRPVFLADGPDGALYVVDMYRAVIEHPEFMPEELKKRPDLTLGKDRGRIWRVVPEKHEARFQKPKLSKASVEELVELLEHTNGWQRSTAQRLLLQRQDPAAVAPLEKLLAATKEPRARVLAAWLLERQKALSDKVLSSLLKDEHPRVREQAIVLAESRLKQSKALREAVLALAGDADARVRFQVALSLGECKDERVVGALARIARKDAGDPWARSAILSSVSKQAGALAEALLTQGKEEEGRALLDDVAGLLGARQDAKEMSRFLTALFQSTEKEAITQQTSGLLALAEGLARRGARLTDFLSEKSMLPRETVTKITAALERAAAKATDTKSELTSRLLAIRLLAHAPWDVSSRPLTRLLSAEKSQDVLLAALRAIAAQTSPDVAGLILEAWKTLTPAARREALDALLRQPERILALFKQIEAGEIKAAELDPIRARQLLAHRHPEVKAKAAKLLQGSLPPDRQQVLARYQAALERKGDPGRGREVFKKHCASCHHLAGIGNNVGPDISDAPRTKNAAALMTDILNPNQAIDNNYLSYQITTKRGQTLTGLIAAETAASITLRRAEGQTDVVLRQDVEEIISSGVSFMPDGMEKVIDLDGMADLLAFLKNWRYLK